MLSKPSEARGKGTHRRRATKRKSENETPRGETRLPSARARTTARASRGGADVIFFPFLIFSGFGVFCLPRRGPRPGLARPERPGPTCLFSTLHARTRLAARGHSPPLEARGEPSERSFSSPAPSDDADGSASADRPTWHHSTTRRHPRAPVASIRLHISPHLTAGGGSGA